MYILIPNSFYPFHHPPFLLVAISLLSVSLYLLYKFHLYHLKDYRYKRYHAILCLVCFTWYDNLLVYPCCCKWHYFFLFSGCHCVSHFYPFICHGHIDCFHTFVLFIYFERIGSLLLPTGFFWLWQVDATLVVLASFVEEHGLIPHPAACGIFLHQGSNP